MLSIGLCDDEEPELAALHGFVSSYARRKGLAFDVERFGSGEDLLGAIEGGRSFDIVFLDVLMGLSSGVETAREIRRLDEACAIVFATNSRGHAIDGYGVRALQYLLKPLSDASVSMALDQAVDGLARGADRFIRLGNRNGCYRIALSDIEYAESSARVVTVHCARQGDLEFYMRLDELERLCGDGRFLRCHKSYLVNLDRVYAVADHCLRLESGRAVRYSMRPAEVKGAFAAHAAKGL